MFTLPTHPQSIREIIHNSFATWRASFLPTLPLAIALCVVVAVLSFFLARPFPNQLIMAKIISYNIPVLILAGLIVFWLYAALYHLTHTNIHHRNAKILDSLIVGLKRLFYIIVGIFIFTLFLGIFTLIVSTPFIIITQKIILLQSAHPSISMIAMKMGSIVYLDLLIMTAVYVFFTVLLLFYLPLIVVMNLNPFSAFGESFVLVWGNWWRTALITGLLYMVVPTILVSFGWFIAYGLGLHFLSMQHAVILHCLLQGIISGLYVPFYCAVILVQLHDLMLRRKLKKSSPQ